MALIEGDELGNSLDGGTEADTIFGKGGQDSLYALGNYDTLYGGDGGDFLWFDMIESAGGVGYGGKGNDTLYGGSIYSDVSAYGGQGADHIEAYKAYGGGGNDTLTAKLEAFGGFGNDYITLIGDESGGGIARGEGGSDTISGDNYADTIILGRKADTGFGSFGNDTIYGGEGSDTVIGGNEADWLFGGTGQDNLTGGSGADVFKYRSAAEMGNGGFADVITDFSSDDTIDLSRVASNLTFIGAAKFSLTAGEVRATTDETGATLVRVDVDGDGQADGTINLGVLSGALTAADFDL